jgi:predicted PurR-regulated permease PerM
MKTLQLPFYLRLALVLLSLIAIGFLVLIGKEVLSPLLFSFMFAMLLLPLCRFFEQKCRLPRSAAAMLSVVLFLAAIVCTGYAVATQIAGLVQDFPALKQQLTNTGNDIHYWLRHQVHIDNQQLKKVQSGAVDATTGALGDAVASLSSVVLFGIFMFIYTFFLLFYRQLLMTFLLMVFNEEHNPLIHDIMAQIQFIMKKYISGLFLEMCTVAILTSSLLGIIGARYALLLGLITAIFNLIPYVGIFTAMGISALITLGTMGVEKALMVAGSIIVVHLLDSNILMPRIVGSKVQINALFVVIGVVLGEMLWGLSGMFLSIPVIAMLKIIFDRIEPLKPWGYLLGGLEYQRLVKFSSDELPDADDNQTDKTEQTPA